jgi:hypothetical protein
VGAKVSVVVHDVDERTLDKIGERQGTAELPVTLDPLVHRTGDLDAQWREFFRGFELEQGHGDFLRRWVIGGADGNGGAARSRLAFLTGQIWGRWTL